MWTTGAPARAASSAESAICSGVTGTLSLRAVVSPAPVTAQVMNASVFIASIPRRSAAQRRFDGGGVGQQLGRVLGAGGLEHVGGRARLDDLALGHDDHPVGDGADE